MKVHNIPTCSGNLIDREYRAPPSLRFDDFKRVIAREAHIELRSDFILEKKVEEGEDGNHPVVPNSNYYLKSLKRKVEVVDDDEDEIQPPPKNRRDSKVR